MEHQNLDQKWPDANDQLITSGPDWMNNACLNYGLDLRWVYNEGFYKAARLLVEGVVNSGRDQDTLIYPVLYLYRHYVEIQLKAIAHVGSDLHNESVPDLSKTHDLHRLWQIVRPLVERTWPNEGRAELDSVGGVIAELNQMDPTSTAFRYAYQRNGNASLDGHTHINVRNVGEVMAGVHNLLHGCYGAMSDMRDRWHEA